MQIDAARTTYKGVSAAQSVPIGISVSAHHLERSMSVFLGFDDAGGVVQVGDSICPRLNPGAGYWARCSEWGMWWAVGGRYVCKGDSARLTAFGKGGRLTSPFLALSAWSWVAKGVCLATSVGKDFHISNKLATKPALSQQHLSRSSAFMACD